MPFKRFLVATILVAVLAGGFVALGVLERSSAADMSYSPGLPNKSSLIVRAHDTLQGMLLLPPGRPAIDFRCRW